MLSVGFAGTERHAIELANALAARGDPVALLLRKRPREAHRQAAYEAMRAYVSQAVRVFETSRAAPVTGLWHALLRFRPDIVHAHHERGVRLASSYAGRVPVIGTVHVHFNARDYMRCDSLICLTEAERNMLPKAYPGLAFVIGNWVTPHPRPSPDSLAGLRAALGLCADDVVIGSVARLEPVKGLAELIKAFARADLPRSRLVIIGEGSQRAELAALASGLGMADRVVLAGFRRDVRDLYSVFDLFVLNSTDEPYGLAILEAAEAGVPVIAAASAGPLSIARSLPVTLVPVGATGRLADALRRVYGGDRVVCDMQPFSLAARMTDITAAYRQTIARSRSTA